MVKANLIAFLETICPRVHAGIVRGSSPVYPAITYSTVANNPRTDLAGAHFDTSETYQVGAWARSYEEADALADLVRALNGAHGSWFGVNVGCIVSAAGREDFFEKEKLDRITVDVTIYY